MQEWLSVLKQHCGVLIDHKSESEPHFTTWSRCRGFSRSKTKKTCEELSQLCLEARRDPLRCRTQKDSKKQTKVPETAWKIFTAHTCTNSSSWTWTHHRTQREVHFVGRVIIVELPGMLLDAHQQRVALLPSNWIGRKRHRNQFCLIWSLWFNICAKISHYYPAWEWAAGNYSLRDCPLARLNSAGSEHDRSTGVFQKVKAEPWMSSIKFFRLLLSVFQSADDACKKGCLIPTDVLDVKIPFFLFQSAHLSVLSNGKKNRKPQRLVEETIWNV